MLHGTPAGSKGGASPSGWKNTQLFLPVLQHFVQNERPSKEHPKLIILDNHESHLGIAALNFAKRNGILLLTLPPHCSHKLQPLDLAVFGPFKKYYGASCDRWMVNHAEKPITIYDIGSLVGEAFLQAFTPKNICSGFRAAGIEPFNDLIFSHEEFLSSYVTDRPGKTSEEEVPQSGSSQDTSLSKPIQHGMTDPVLSQFQLSQYQESQAGPSQAESSSTAKLQTEKSQTKPTLSSIEIKKPTLQIITPEQIRPHPKAGERKSTIRRKKGRSLILTDTPVKENIEEEARLREEKAHKKKQNN
ncbi:unnamed protein product [Acanthoscelides obtectus]|uniref:DDE-1 domain-containing protein n=1 Tax=Acanthoscelides obtectus TaxID=200917 RepID=A0A9P0PWR7_ACAOB|nr:unnamed protein product [Acanthoscelides obtectus]CAK1674691.1 hypothetical protein AOBTE_LOCUS29707 [Acanthoscelides obtectus]